MTIIYSGNDGGISFNIARGEPGFGTTTINRGFLKFDTSGLVGVTSAVLKFTAFSKTGEQNIRLRAGGDIVGNGPNIPSREDNWTAFDSLSVIGFVEANEGLLSIDVLSGITSTITSFRLASNQELTSGTRTISVYTKENVTDIPYIEYATSAYVSETPNNYAEPVTQSTPDTYEEPSGVVGVSGIIYPTYDFGIRMSSEIGDILPPGEN